MTIRDEQSALQTTAGRKTRAYSTDQLGNRRDRGRNEGDGEKRCDGSPQAQSD
jgi:hypothetical protein